MVGKNKEKRAEIKSYCQGRELGNLPRTDYSSSESGGMGHMMGMRNLNEP